MHPLDKFNYCPMCGSKHFEPNDEKSKRCGSCGFVYYMNPSSATAAFIINSRRELLVERRGHEPAKGTFDLPGGFVDCHESGEEGIVREVREETGLDVAEATFMFSIPNVYRYSGMDIHTLDMFFRCTVTDDREPRAADDAAECLWVPLADIDPGQFGLSSIREALRRFLDAQKQG